MSEQLRETINRLQELPEETQDSIARAIIYTLDAEEDRDEHHDI